MQTKKIALTLLAVTLLNAISLQAGAGSFFGGLGAGGISGFLLGKSTNNSDDSSRVRTLEQKVRELQEANRKLIARSS
ncbi:hypothetical protein HOL34_00680 [bacterium]|jgi:hypothetical protein|nr:hypothetical protein [bacterium]MBT3903534.1 hypothetical protein [bacterium]MBT4578031.1 hypothetical protein [bacterium]MBT5346130.1 hypothetical protein [bacterium]MBT6528609.1 hypothetical protein [bacterium]